MEILKDLLKKVFDAPLNRLEKRSALQMEDLKYEKKCYTQQGKLLDFLSTVKIKPIAKKKPLLKRERSADTMRRNNTFKNPSNKTREKTPDLNNHKITINKTRNKTPNLTSKNGIPSYMMGTANSQKNKKEAIHNHYYNLRKQREEDEEKDKKISLTPEPKKKKNVKKKNIDNNSNDHSQLTINNINIIKKDDLNDKKSNASNINLMNNEIGLNHNESYLNNNKQENEILKSPFEKKKEDINIKNFGNFLMSKENEKIFNIILSFLNQKEKMDFILTNKKFLPYLLSIIETYKDNLEKKYEIITDSTIENRKQNLKIKYPNLNTTDVPTYKMGNSTEKSLNLINYNNKIFHEKNLTSEQENIIIIYRIFFQLIKQSEISNIKNNKEFWIKCCNYINENGKDKTGDFFKDSSNNFDFSAENIFKIKKMIEGNENKITIQNYYSSFCGTTALVAFLIRDVLEFIGVLKNEKKNDENYLYRNLEYLDYVYVKVSDYIKRLKNAINSNK